MADNENNTNSAPSPAPVRRTIRLKPIQPKAPAQGVNLPGVTDAAPQVPPAQVPQASSQQTIRLTPRTPETPTPVIPQAPEAQAAPVSSVPGAKQTIKLRPSGSASVAPGEGRPSSVQTIKLTPPSEQASSPDAPPMAKRTIKLSTSNGASSASQDAANPSSRTINLNGQATPQSSTPTINMGTAPKRLQIKKVSGEPALPPSVKNAPASFEEAQKLKKQKKSSGKDEGNIFFLISSVVALLVIGSIALMFYAQYANMNKAGEDMNIGIPRYTGSKAVPYVPKAN